MGKKGGGLGGLFLGSLIGGAIALLFTPFTGEEARKRVQEKLGTLSAVPDTVNNIKDKAPEAIETTISSIEDGIARLSLAIEEAKKAAEDKRKELGGQQ